MEHGTGEKRDSSEIKADEKLYARKAPQGDEADDAVGEEWSPSQDRKEHPGPEISPDDADRASDADKSKNA